MKEAENEKLSLVTVIKLLQIETSNSEDGSNHSNTTIKANDHRGKPNDDIQIVYTKPSVETRNRYSTLSDTMGKSCEDCASTSTSDSIQPEMSKAASEKPDQHVYVHGKSDEHAKKHRKSRTTVIVGDSMTKHINAQRLERSVQGSKVRLETYRGANVEAMSHHIQPCLKKNPDDLIIHVGTNDLKNKSASDVANDIITLCNGISEKHPSTRIIISELITRTDQKDLEPKIREVNSILTKCCRQRNWGLIRHNNIGANHLNNYGLHLNKLGTAVLAKNIIKFLNN